MSTPMVRITGNVQLIGHGYGSDTVITAAVVADVIRAQEIADAQTIRETRDALAKEEIYVRIHRVIQTVPLLQAVED